MPEVGDYLVFLWIQIASGLALEAAFLTLNGSCALCGRALLYRSIKARVDNIKTALENAVKGARTHDIPKLVARIEAMLSHYESELAESEVCIDTTRARQHIFPL